MKKLLVLAALLLCVFSYSQDPDSNIKVNVVKFVQGNSTLRNTYVVPTGETWLYDNSTTGTLQLNRNGTGWVDVGGGIPDDNSVTSSKVLDGTLEEGDLKISNSPTSGYSLTSDGTTGYTWANVSAGSSASHAKETRTITTSRSLTNADFETSGGKEIQHIVGSGAGNETITLTIPTGLTKNVTTFFIPNKKTDKIIFATSAVKLHGSLNVAVDTDDVVETLTVEDKNEVAILRTGTDIFKVSGNADVTFMVTDVMLTLPSLFGYYREDGISETSGAIADWVDATGNGNDFVTGVSPTVTTNTTTGAKEAAFDGTNDNLSLTENSADFEPVPGTDSFYFIIKNGETVPNNTGYIYGRSGSSGATRPYTAFVTASDDIRVYAGGTLINVNNAFVPNCVVVINHKGATVDVWVDGTKVVDAATSGTNDSTSNPFRLGSRGDLVSGWLDFDLAMFALGEAALTDTQIAAIFTQEQEN